VKRTLQVYLGEAARHVGTLHFDADGARESSAFVYTASWLSDPGRFVLAPELPLMGGPPYRKRVPGGSVFHGVFADSEPDGWGRRVILRDHAKGRVEAKSRGRQPDRVPLQSVDFLLSVDDASRVGAIRFRDEEGVFCRPSEPGQRSVPPMVELRKLLGATRAVESESESAGDLAYLPGRATSLGGMRPKCTVVDEKGRLAIGKFPSISDEHSVTKGEVLAMHLAAAAGIDAAPSRLVDCEGAPVALIERFDRGVHGGRLHYASAATMLEVEPGESRESTYTELADLIRRHGHDSAGDLVELWRRIAFTILITNVEDHLRNHGFLHVGRGLWKLSPAFDLNPFPEHHRELKTWISEETGPDASIEGLLSVISFFRIPVSQARTILGEVVRAVSTWREQGRGLGMSEGELDRFAGAFEHSESEAAKREAGKS
jgi:serine/threonine-protein kinase HipA